MVKGDADVYDGEASRQETPGSGRVFGKVVQNALVARCRVCVTFGEAGKSFIDERKAVNLHGEGESLLREKEILGICQDTSKKLVRSLFIPEEPQQGLCPYASLPQDIFLT